MKIVHRIIGLILLISSSSVWCAITVDRTRLIFDDKNQTVSMGITNTDKTKPYLAQIWIEDDKGNKIVDDAPLIATPPVIRMDPDSKSLVRITKTPLAGKLPPDRESLFFLNIREIPPKNNDKNVLQVALQTSMKLIYRPDSLKLKHGDFKGKDITVRQTKDGYEFNNPTPYVFTIADISEVNKNQQDSEFASFILPPKKTTVLKAVGLSTDYLSIVFINDFGGRVIEKISVRD